MSRFLGGVFGEAIGFSTSIQDAAAAVYTLKEASWMKQRNGWIPGMSATGGNSTDTSTFAGRSVHIFTTPGNFVVSEAGPGAVEVLVVGGGGGGGAGTGGPTYSNGADSNQTTGSIGGVATGYGGTGENAEEGGGAEDSIGGGGGAPDNDRTTTPDGADGKEFSNFSSFGASGYFSGGGGGSCHSCTPGTGGTGGGGAGKSGSNQGGGAGTANTGGGGGGARGTDGNSRDGGVGGSGVVLIRYAGGTAASGGTITAAGGYTYHAFTSTGAATFTPS